MREAVRHSCHSKPVLEQHLPDATCMVDQGYWKRIVDEDLEHRPTLQAQQKALLACRPACHFDVANYCIHDPLTHQGALKVIQLQAFLLHMQQMIAGYDAHWQVCIGLHGMT